MRGEATGLWSDDLGAAGASWSNQDITLEERARQHGRYGVLAATNGGRR